MAYLIRSTTAPKYKNYSSFVLNRLTRIYPTYILALCAAVIVDVSIGSPILKSILMLPKVDLFFSIIANATMIGLSGNTFPSNLRQDWIYLGPAWSLTPEILFYLLSPIILSSKYKTSKSVLIQISILFFGLILEFKNYEFFLGNFFPLGKLFWFMLGSLTFTLFNSRAAIFFRFKTFNLLTLTVFIGMCFLLRINEKSPMNEVRTYFITIFFCIVMYMSFQATINNKFDFFLGRISYPVYLIHPLIKLIQKELSTEDSLAIYNFESFLIYILTSVCIAAIIVYFFEYPIDEYRKSRFRKER